jgi:hypothetical protein
MARKEEMSTTNIFRNGIPYGPDLKRLDDYFPASELTEGRVIPVGELEAAISENRGTSRFYGVITAWRNRQRNDNGIYIKWEPRVGLKVLSPAEILGHAETLTRRGIRHTGRGIKTFGYVDRERLDHVGQKRLDHQCRIITALKGSMDQANKQLAIDLAPVQSLPKRTRLTQ